VDRDRQPRGMLPQRVPRLRMLTEREEPTADRVAGGLVPGLHQQLAVEEQLLVGERRTLERAAHERSDEIVLRLAAALRDQLGEARVDLAPRALRGPARRLV